MHMKFTFSFSPSGSMKLQATGSEQTSQKRVAFNSAHVLFPEIWDQHFANVGTILSKRIKELVSVMEVSSVPAFTLTCRNHSSPANPVLFDKLSIDYPSCNKSMLRLVCVSPFVHFGASAGGSKYVICSYSRSNNRREYQEVRHWWKLYRFLLGPVGLSDGERVGQDPSPHRAAYLANGSLGRGEIVLTSDSLIRSDSPACMHAILLQWWSQTTHLGVLHEGNPAGQFNYLSIPK